MQKKYKLVVIVILSLFLIGGASMVIIKGVEHLRIEKQKRQKAESIKESKKEVKEQAEARQKIALWVVQHYEGPEPIKMIGVGKIYTSGILGSGGKSVSVIINDEEKNIIDGILIGDDFNPRHPGAQFKSSDYNYVEQAMDKKLDGIEIKYWGENNSNDSEN